MMITIHFLDYGKSISIMRKFLSEIPGTTQSILRMNYSTHGYEYFRCLLFLPCKQNCQHRRCKEVEISLDDGEENCLLEMLYVALSHQDEKIRCRAATLIGLIGNKNSTPVLMGFLGEKQSDFYWAVIDSIRKLDTTLSFYDLKYR